MKTAISIPDNVFAAAERAARKLGVSRSEFYTRAAQRLARKVESPRLTAKINAALDRIHGPKELDPALARLQSAALADDPW
jgi:hypothetical protein